MYDFLPNGFVLYHFLDDFISHNATIHSLVTVGAKPSFLLWDKVYQKLNAVEDETWLLRAAEAALSYFQGELMRSEQAWSVLYVT